MKNTKDSISKNKRKDVYNYTKLQKKN